MLKMLRQMYTYQIDYGRSKIQRIQIIILSGLIICSIQNAIEMLFVQLQQEQATA